MNIKTMSIEGLKAAVYDNLVLIEQGQKNVRILNEELAQRQAKPEEPSEEKPEKSK